MSKKIQTAAARVINEALSSDDPLDYMMLYVKCRRPTKIGITDSEDNETEVTVPAGTVGQITDIDFENRKPFFSITFAVLQKSEDDIAIDTADMRELRKNYDVMPEDYKPKAN